MGRTKKITLTRQVGKIIILYNQEAYHLMKYASETNSDIAKRFTDLFADVFPDDHGAHKPQITKVGDTFFDEKLIHKTARGELVRSKSEVIIADALFHNGLDYQYDEIKSVINSCFEVLVEKHDYSSFYSCLLAYEKICGTAISYILAKKRIDSLYRTPQNNIYSHRFFRIYVQGFHLSLERILEKKISFILNRQDVQ